MTGTPSPRSRTRRLVATVIALMLLGGGYLTFATVQSPLAIAEVEVDAASVVTDDTGYLVPYTPSGEVLLRVHLRNDGRLPLRLTGIAAPWIPTSDPATSAPIGPFYRAVAVLYDGERAIPFHAVELAAGEALSAGLRLTMCPAGTPGSDDGRVTVFGIDLIYRYAGWERTHGEDLTRTVSAPSYKCDYAGKHL